LGYLTADPGMITVIDRAVARLAELALVGKTRLILG
jgi:hypothetical protein